MASTGSNWETVGKPSKRTKAVAHNGMTKAEKQSFLDSMPRIEKSDPVKESSTIYDAFLWKEKQKHQKENQTKANEKASSAKKVNQNNKTNKQVSNKKKQKTLEEAVREVSLAELENVLLKVQTTFPDNSSIWLKDLASVLNLKMDNVPEPDPVFQNKPHDYPLCLLEKPVRKMLHKTINQCSTKTLEIFLEHCIQSMVSDMGREVPTYGFRMFIQLLQHEKPDLIMSSLQKYHDLIKMNQNRPLRFLAILWAIGQTGVKSFQNGWKIWQAFLLPGLKIRAMSTYSVEYLENLFKIHKDLKSGPNLKPKDFFNVVDVIYTSHPNVPTALQKRLQALYPDLQKLAFGHNPEGGLHQLFPMFLSRCTGNSKQLQSQMLAGAVTCLSKDKASFSQWRQIYTKDNLVSSGQLLSHLRDKLASVSKVLDKPILKETIRSFSVTNEDLTTKGQQQLAGLNQCSSACKELLEKMSTPSFPWKTFVLLLLTLIAGVIAFDVYVNKGLKSSRTYKFLDDARILIFLEQTWSRIVTYSTEGFNWLRENIPIYYGKMCKLVGPYLSLFWEKLYEFGVFVLKATEPIRAWLNVKIPQLLEWIQTNFPWLRDGVVRVLSNVWDVMVVYGLWLFQCIVNASTCASSWLLENVFTGSLSPENILRVLSLVFSTIQSYVTHAVQYISHLLQTNPDNNSEAKQA